VAPALARDVRWGPGGRGTGVVSLPPNDRCRSVASATCIRWERVYIPTPLHRRPSSPCRAGVRVERSAGADAHPGRPL